MPAQVEQGPRGVQYRQKPKPRARRTEQAPGGGAAPTAMIDGFMSGTGDSGTADRSAMRNGSEVPFALAPLDRDTRTPSAHQNADSTLCV